MTKTILSKLFQSTTIFRRKSPLVFLCTFLLSLVVYYVTLLPEVDFGDSAELSMQAYQLGVTHPPGYPVHTILGKILGLVLSDSAIATNFLSALCTSLTVGLMSIMILGLTNNLYGALLVPLIFAFSPRVWSMAVTTEVYNVNILFLALSIYFFLHWYKKSSRVALFTAATFFGISLGTYLANAILFPAFVFLLFKKERWRLTQLLIFNFIVLTLGISILSFSYIRSDILPPIGTEFIPQSLLDSLRYFSGQQYDTTSISDVKFFLERIILHAWIFSKNFLFVAIGFGLIGIVSLWRSQRDTAYFFLIFLAINLGYFTFYNAIDFYFMVTPSYFVFSLFIAYGFGAIWTKLVRFRLLSIALLFLICILNLGIQFHQRIERAQSYKVTNFVLSSFRAFPPNAVVISHWDHFTSFLYFQKTRNLRPDCILIERTNQRRYYEQGIVDSSISYLYSQISLRPVVIDEVSSELRFRFKVTPLDKYWFLITPLIE